jgi:hypothetical protein
MKRPGLYVLNRYFAYRYAQALAYAQYKTKEYGRLVTVVEVLHPAASNIFPAKKG